MTKKKTKKKILVIVESPSKAKTIGKFLGSNYKVTASVGHVRDLPKSKMGVDIEHGFEPKYIPVRDKKELIDQLKKAFPDLGEITITSPGVVIGAHCGPGLLTVFYFCNGRKP